MASSEEWLQRVSVPTAPSAVLLGLGLVDLVIQGKELSNKLLLEKETKDPRRRELNQLEAGSRFLEECLLDIITLLAAAVAINWLYRSGLKPLAWSCVILPLILISITIILHVKRLRNQTSRTKLLK